MESLETVFPWGHQFLVKKHSRHQIWRRERAFYGQELIKEATSGCSSPPRMSPAAEENRRGCGPFDASLGVVDSLKTCFTHAVESKPSFVINFNVGKNKYSEKEKYS